MKKAESVIKSFSIKDLLLIKNDATSYYNNFPNGKKLHGTKSVLSSGDILALSYFHAIIQYLKRNGVVSAEFDGRIDFEEANSRTGG